MIKKILGGLVFGIMLIEAPLLVVAVDDPCASATYDMAGCAAQNSPATAGVVTPANNGTAGVVTPATQQSGQGTEVTAQLQNPIKYDTFSDFIAAIIGAAVDILLPFVVLAFIWSGFLFVKAQGNTEQLENAKTAIIWSVVGAFILFGAWGFAQIIGRTVSTITK